MEISHIAFALPIFLLLMGIEYVIARFRYPTLYEIKDFSTNLNCGLFEETCCLPLKGLLIFCYYTIYENHALFVINPKSPMNWVLLWISIDFFYYWFHRASHRINFLWIGHSVHHQSEYYNLSVALRQGIGQTLFSWVFYLPLAWLGFPTWMFLIVSSSNTLYQFWIHTPLIKHLGWFESIFNTPSHHRVHHGKNPEYIDKNYAGSLIIWDKLFGTFEKETVPAEYGTTAPLNSWNPFYANVRTLTDLLYYGKYLNSLTSRILIFFRSPEWIVHALGKQAFQQNECQELKQNITCPTAYVLINMLIAICAYAYFLINFNLRSPSSGVLGIFILTTLVQLGFVLNQGMSDTIKLFDLFRSILILEFFLLLFQDYRFAFMIALFSLLLSKFCTCDSSRARLGSHGSVKP